MPYSMLDAEITIFMDGIFPPTLSRSVQEENNHHLTAQGVHCSAGLTEALSLSEYQLVLCLCVCVCE